MVTTVAGAAWAAAGKADTKPAARITDAATRCQRPPIPFSLVIEPLLHRRVPQWWPAAGHQIGPGAAPSTVLCPYGNGRSRSRKPLAWDAGHVRLHCGSIWATSALQVLNPHRPLWLG